MNKKIEILLVAVIFFVFVTASWVSHTQQQAQEREISEIKKEVVTLKYRLSDIEKQVSDNKVSDENLMIEITRLKSSLFELQNWSDER